MDKWKEVHPVRAYIAVTAITATVVFLWREVSLIEAWWGVVGVVIGYYFAKGSD